MNTRLLTLVLALAGFATLPQLHAQIPQIMNYQGRVVVGTTNFNGTGQFKFALVNAVGTTTYWSNDGTSSAGSQPTNAVSLTVSKGLYSVLLGDTTVANMPVAIPASVFNNSDVRLRVWFNDGTTGSQLLTPDQRIASVGYSMLAANVADGAITTAKIANGAVNSVQIANGAVGSAQIANGGVSASQIADSSITAAKIGAGQVVKSVNGLSDTLTLAAGANISITPSGNTLTLAATGASNIWQYSGATSNVYYLGGTVGLGTSSPAVRLHVSDLSGIDARFDGPSPMLFFMDTASSNALTGLQASAGGLRVLNGNLNNTIMTLSAAGNLGLGTSTPSSPLHIKNSADSIRLTATNPYITFEEGGPASYSRIQGNVNGIDLKSQGAATGSNPGGLIHLDGVGTVGIGTTTPRHQLSIRYFAGAPTWTSNGWIGAIDLDNAAAIGWAPNSAGQAFGIGHTNGSLAMFRTTSTPGTTGSAAIYDFIIGDTGLIGIGLTGPLTKLHIYDPQSVSERIQTAGGTNSWTRVEFVNGNGEWDIGTSRGFNSDQFYINRSGGTGISFAVQANGDAYVQGTMSCRVLTIRGGSDLAEPFAMSQRKVAAGAVVVIDDRNAGKLRVSDRSYDKKVAGIVSGANGISPGISMTQESAFEDGENVALSGRVYVKANTSGGVIQPGDLLTTSDIPGEAMKAADHGRAQGAILGKAMTPLQEGDGMVLTLVSLQ